MLKKHWQERFKLKWKQKKNFESTSCNGFRKNRKIKTLKLVYGVAAIYHVDAGYILRDFSCVKMVSVWRKKCLGLTLLWFYE